MTIAYADTPNTATATPGLFDAARTDGFGKDGGGTKWRDVQTDRGDDTGSLDPPLSAFEAMVRRYLSAPAGQKDSDRELIIEELRLRERLAERVSRLLSAATNSSWPGRLDSAVDILCDDRVDLSTYLACALRPPSIDQLEPYLDGDALYVLVRAVGKRRDQRAAFLISWALRQTRPSIREAAVEALADIGTTEAAAELRTISQQDKSIAVRRTALECLFELDKA